MTSSQAAADQAIHKTHYSVLSKLHISLRHLDIFTNNHANQKNERIKTVLHIIFQKQHQLAATLCGSRPPQNP